MTSITEILAKQPSDFFLGVVELELSIVVGLLEDPMGIELTNVRLGYPIELAQRWENADVIQAVIVPESGVPEEMVIEAGAVSVYNGGSQFGLTYFKHLKEVSRISAAKFTSKQIQRAQIYKGGNSGGVR